MMKKKFAFLGFHVNEDIKHAHSVKNKEFFKNPVMLKTDRFLEKELRDVIKLGPKRPYTFVVNTAGCNKNCWFCYAYPILKKEDYEKCETIFLSPEELTKCFVDKLYSLKKSAIKDRYNFFSKLRITGGEPLYSTQDTLKESEGKNYPSETIDYFLKFFELLDPHITKLVKEEAIYLSTPKKYSRDIPFPTFLCTPDNRIEIRFDTNGFLFSDYDFADKFVGGIYNLLEKNKLKNLLIRIDYSLKGAHPLEAHWSQRENFPVNESRTTDFDLEQHPQYSGLNNIFRLIREYCQKDQKFGNCLGITVERGISNVKGHFMYFENGMNWPLLQKKLQEKLGAAFKLSTVDNKMEVGINWAKLRTHLKRGVAIKVIFNGEEVVYEPTQSKNEADKLIKFLGKLKGENKKFDIIYVPREESRTKCHQQLLKL